MKDLTVILAAMIVALSLHAGAQPETWTQFTNINGTSALLSDGTNLYQIYNGGAGGVGEIWQYDGPAADAWTLIATAGRSLMQYWSPGEGDRACYMSGKLFTREANDGVLNIYDISTGTFTHTPPPLVDPVNGALAWTQGWVYMPNQGSAGQILVTWTEKDKTTGTNTVNYAACLYDVGTGSWGTSYDFEAATGQIPKWTRMATIAVGDYVLAQTDNTNYMGQTDGGKVGVDVYDLSTQPADFSGTWTYQSHDLTAGQMTNNTGSCFGTEAMAVDPGTGLVYVTAVDIEPMRFVSYNPATNTWTELADGAGGGGYRTHDNSDEASGWIYSRQGPAFEGYELPTGGLPGDVDGNGVVDGLDLTAVLTAWETTPVDPLWNPDADLDGNDVIDGLDLTEVISNWTVAAAAPAAAAADTDAKPERGKGNVKAKKK